MSSELSWLVLGMALTNKDVASIVWALPGECFTAGAGTRLHDAIGKDRHEVMKALAEIGVRPIGEERPHEAAIRTLREFGKRLRIGMSIAKLTTAAKVAGPEEIKRLLIEALGFVE